MSAPKQIVVGFDGTSESLDAARWAAGWAAAHGGSVRLVWVESGTGGEGDAHLAEARRALASEFGEGLSISGEVRTGKVVEQLSAAASEGRLLVVGASGRGPLASALSGNVSEALAARMPGTTVIVPTAVRDFVHDGPVVLGLDGSDESLRGAEFAFEAAATMGVELLVVQVHEVFAGGAGVGIASEQEFSETSSLGGLEPLRAQYPDLSVTFVPVVTWARRLADVGRPAVQLADRAEGASLVVIGTRGQGPLGSLVFGSTGRDLARLAPCPVAIVV